DMEVEQTGIPEILGALKSEGIRFNDVRTEQSSLEEIFIELIADKTG
ncbi:MAG TPA: multidrug ABC transporter ATP-binding protein, partial [Gammaproteobacteria bacterium]|nr:multidrug ABC transporter ATP-binding protein [Gammaproteobacteria bacterium]